MKKLTQEEVIHSFKAVHGDKYDYSKFVYNDNHTKGIIICPVHGEFIQTPAKHKAGKGCKRCACSLINETRKIDKDEFIRRSTEKHNGNYDYSSVDYKGLQEYVDIICPEHGVFRQRASEHMNGAGCKKCAIEKSRKTFNDLETIKQKIKEIHGERYDYDFSNYKGGKSTLKIKCEKHGWFDQTVSYHLRGSGCPKCAIEKNTELKRHKQEDILKRIDKIYDGQYEIKNFEYKRIGQYVDVLCKKHNHNFRTTVGNLLHGHGCPMCGLEKYSEKRSFTFDDFLQRAKEMHGDKFEYDKDSYTNFQSPVGIYCKEHKRWFSQIARNHANGQIACPSCYSTKSRGEEQLFQFVKQICPDAIQSDRKLLKGTRCDGKEIDIYVPNKTLAIEYDGLYWHSEAKIKDDTHRIKTECCAEKGVQLIHIFEDEWNEKPEIVMAMIRNKLGLKSESIAARKCEIVMVGINDSKDFYNTNHIQGYCYAHVNVGLKYGDRLVAMMSFDNTQKSLSKNGWTLVRFATELNTRVNGAAGKLLTWFERNYNPIEIVSYADRRISDGNLYKVLGFKLDKITPISYSVIIDNERFHRFKFRKENLVKRYGCPEWMSEHEFCLMNHWYRIYDCGKLVYKKSAKDSGKLSYKN